MLSDLILIDIFTSASNYNFRWWITDFIWLSCNIELEIIHNSSKIHSLKKKIAVILVNIDWMIGLMMSLLSIVTSTWHHGQLNAVDWNILIFRVRWYTSPVSWPLWCPSWWHLLKASTRTNRETVKCWLLPVLLEFPAVSPLPSEVTTKTINQILNLKLTSPWLSKFNGPNWLNGSFWTAQSHLVFSRFSSCLSNIWKCLWKIGFQVFCSALKWRQYTLPFVITGEDFLQLCSELWCFGCWPTGSPRKVRPSHRY